MGPCDTVHPFYNPAASKKNEEPGSQNVLTWERLNRAEGSTLQNVYGMTHSCVSPEKYVTIYTHLRVRYLQCPRTYALKEGDERSFENTGICSIGVFTSKRIS